MTDAGVVSAREREEDEVAPATFQSNADGPFYDFFLLFFFVHRHAKGETGNPF